MLLKSSNSSYSTFSYSSCSSSFSSLCSSFSSSYFHFSFFTLFYSFIYLFYILTAFFPPSSFPSPSPKLSIFPFLCSHPLFTPPLFLFRKEQVFMCIKKTWHTKLQKDFTCIKGGQCDPVWGVGSQRTGISVGDIPCS